MLLLGMTLILNNLDYLYEHVTMELKNLLYGSRKSNMFRGDHFGLVMDGWTIRAFCVDWL